MPNPNSDAPTDRPERPKALVDEVALLIVGYLDAYDDLADPNQVRQTELMRELDAAGVLNATDLSRVVAIKIVGLLFHSGALTEFRQ
jgi:hypothetical protein